MIEVLIGALIGAAIVVAGELFLVWLIIFKSK